MNAPKDRSALGRKSRKWQWFGDESEHWADFSLPPFGFTIRGGDGKYRGIFRAIATEFACGPWRKSERAAHNDALKWAKRLRAELVVFGRAKLL